MASHNKLNEGMRAGDLSSLVLPLISVDEYESKVDEKAIVIGLYVQDKDAANDLNRFVQKSALAILDTEVSPAPDQHGYYLVFVEFMKNDRLCSSVASFLEEIEPLVEITEWQMRVRKVDGLLDFSETTLRKALFGLKVDEMRTDLEMAEQNKSMNMRRLITIVESSGAGPSELLRKKRKLLPQLAHVMDSRSVAAIYEMRYDTPEEELATLWFDACLSMYRKICKTQKITVYRHMKVEDFDEYLAALRNKQGRLGAHWSFNHSIESPTWDKNHRGNVEVKIEGEIDISQVDWMATLQQNFAWPHEYEVIFSGDVFVAEIENLDDDVTVKLGLLLPR